MNTCYYIGTCLNKKYATTTKPKGDKAKKDCGHVDTIYDLIDEMEDITK